METSLPKRKKDTHPRFNILYFTEVLKEAETDATPTGREPEPEPEPDAN